MPETPTPGSVLIGKLTPPTATIVARLAKEVTADGEDIIALSNLVECDFQGYAPVTITDWEDVNPDSTELTEVLSAVIRFQPAGLVNPQIAMAYYLTIVVGLDPPGLYQLELLDPPVIFDDDEAVFDRQVRIVESFDA